MSRFEREKFNDHGLSDKLYVFAENILKREGTVGVSEALLSLKNKDIISFLNEQSSRGYDIDEIKKVLLTFNPETQYGFRGTLISRLEILKQERKLTSIPYPYPVRGNLSSGQLAMLEASDILFNAELQAFKEGRIKGLLHLGRPLALLRTIGINADEITLSPSVLNRHLKTHGLTVNDLYGLAKAIQTPILSYVHGSKSPNFVLVSDIFVKNGKLSISLEMDEGGNIVELNNVKSIHQKDAIEELDRLNYMGANLKGALRWVEIEKVLDWFSPAGLTSLIQASNPELDSVAKVLKEFENPNIIEEEFIDYNENLTENNRNETYNRENNEPNKDNLLKIVKSAVIERLEQPTLHGRLTDKQLDVLLNYRNFFPEKSEKEIFASLLKDMQKDFNRNMIGEASVDDLKEELEDLSKGIRRDEELNQGLKK